MEGKGANGGAKPLDAGQLRELCSQLKARCDAYEAELRGRGAEEARMRFASSVLLPFMSVAAQAARADGAEGAEFRARCAEDAEAARRWLHGYVFGGEECGGGGDAAGAQA